MALKSNNCRACARCGGDSGVVDSREQDVYIRRRRVCDQCGNRWTTREMNETDLIYTNAARIRALAYLDRAREIFAGTEPFADPPAS